MGGGGWYPRPLHDAGAIAHTHAVTRANQEKGGLGGQWKAALADIAHAKF